VSSPAHASQSETLLLPPAAPPAGILFGRGLRLIHDSETQRWAVCLGGLVLDSWADGDVTSQRLAIARLVNGQLAKATEVAQVFGVHRNTVSRIAREVEAGGATAAIHRKPGPRRRHKVTPRVLGVLREAGARVKLIRDGDVAPAIAAAQPDTGVDMLYGIGGTPEGVISAAALKCVGGGIQGRLWPRDEDERTQLVAEGLDPDRVLYTNDLVRGEDVFVAATGVTNGPLLSGVRYTPGGAVTDSIVMRSRSGTVRRITAQQSIEKLSALTGFEYR